MRKFTLGTIVVVGMATGFTMSIGTGIAAAADPLVGKTYADAASEIDSWGGTAVVVSAVGSRLQRDDCIVTNWHKDTNNNNKFMLALNCNGEVAAAGVPGNSAASPEGRAELQHQAALQWRSENPEWCADVLDQHPDWGQLEGCDYGS